MKFDPDAYLAESSDQGFDPDSYLASSETESFDPDLYLGPESPKMGTVPALAAGIAEGASVGFFDELYGAGMAGAAKLGLVPSKRSLMDEDTFGAEYEGQRDAARATLQRAKQDQPGANMAGQVAGGVATGALTGGAGPLAAKAGLQGLKASMAAGAVEGAAYGLGTSEADSIEDMGVDTLKGATAGAMMPALARGAAKTVQGAADLTGKGLSAVAGIASKDTNKLMIEGAANILGVPAKKLTPEMVEHLKKAGLGTKSKETILKNLEELLATDYKVLNSFKDIVDYGKVLKARTIMHEADQSLVKEMFRKGAKKEIAPEDVLFGVAGGPKALAAKKVRDLIANRAKVYSPELKELGGKVKSALTPDPLAVKSVVGAYENMGSKAGARMPFTQTIMSNERTRKYGNLFTEDPHINAVRHNLLMNSNSEYRNDYMSIEDEDQEDY